MKTRALKPHCVVILVAFPPHPQLDLQIKLVLALVPVSRNPFSLTTCPACVTTLPLPCPALPCPDLCCPALHVAAVANQECQAALSG